MRKHGADGKFVRTIQSWTPECWDDGYVDNRGKFRVYRPDYPKAYRGGYAFRAHIVWWLGHGEVVPAAHVIHHKNGIKDDDRLENLELMGVGEHTVHHCKKQGVPLICKGCGNQFFVPQWRITQRLKEEGRPPKYCSLGCYNNTPRTESHKQNISSGLRAHYANT